MVIGLFFNKSNNKSGHLESFHCELSVKVIHKYIYTYYLSFFRMSSVYYLSFFKMSSLPVSILNIVNCRPLHLRQTVMETCEGGNRF